LTLDNEAIIALLEGFDRESKALKSEAIRLSWHMRGGLNYSEAMTISREEREIIANLIKENLETTKRSGLPFF
jgi:hypothetical protein